MEQLSEDIMARCSGQPFTAEDDSEDGTQDKIEKDTQYGFAGNQIPEIVTDQERGPDVLQLD